MDEQGPKAEAGSERLEADWHSWTFKFHAEGWELFKLAIVNAFLTVVTLGIYYFWARTRIRNYVYSQVEFEGDRLAYHGKATELLFGWLKGVGFLIVTYGILFGAAYLLFGFAERYAPLLGLLFYVPILLFFPIAMVGSIRYRLSRTSWRGIRFSFRGQLGEFYLLCLKGVLLTVITLGLYSPYLVTNIRSYIFNNIWFGTRSFTFTGTGRDLFWPFIKAILIGIFTVQIYQFWFQAEKHRYFWSQTTFDQARFRSTRVGLEFMLLWLGNLALVIFTLGIAVPWVTVRRIRFLTSNLVLEGPLDLPSIEQDYRDAEATGEQIGDAFEFDMLDMGFGI